MPNKDIYHNVVIEALIADGWRIVREHAKVSTDTRRLFIDILAEKVDGQSRALFEVKGFASAVEALAEALGQYLLYLFTKEYSGLDLPLFLAVPVSAYEGILSESIGMYARKMGQFKLMVFEPTNRRIIEWI